MYIDQLGTFESNKYNKLLLLSLLLIYGKS